MRLPALLLLTACAGESTPATGWQLDATWVDDGEHRTLHATWKQAVLRTDGDGTWWLGQAERVAWSADGVLRHDPRDVVANLAVPVVWHTDPHGRIDRWRLGSAVDPMTERTLRDVLAATTTSDPLQTRFGPVDLDGDTIVGLLGTPQLSTPGAVHASGTAHRDDSTAHLHLRVRADLPWPWAERALDLRLDLHDPAPTRLPGTADGWWSRAEAWPAQPLDGPPRRTSNLRTPTAILAVLPTDQGERLAGDALAAHPRHTQAVVSTCPPEHRDRLVVALQIAASPAAVDALRGLGEAEAAGRIVPFQRADEPR